MIRDSKIRQDLKEKVFDWQVSNGVYSNRDSLDTMIKETFFFIYKGLGNGDDIHSLGNKLGLLPFP